MLRWGKARSTADPKQSYKVVRKLKKDVANSDLRSARDSEDLSFSVFVSKVIKKMGHYFLSIIEAY